MSRGQRIGLVVVAAVIAVVAFVIAKPGGDDSKDTTKTQASGPSKPPGPQVTRIQLKGHNPVGGRKTIKVKRDDQVRIVVTSDAADEVHLHGYDIEREVGPGKPGRYAFKADKEGAYELETHSNEQKIAILQVQPR